MCKRIYICMCVSEFVIHAGKQRKTACSSGRRIRVFCEEEITLEVTMLFTYNGWRNVEKGAR